MLVWLTTVALAGSTYVNGVNVDGLRNQTFDKVNAVHIDAEGNVRIDAPGYDIQVVDTPPNPVPERPDPAPPVTPDATADGTLAPGSVDNGVPIARWWLISEDNASFGHVVEVFINGQSVKKIPSGQPQMIQDLQPYVRIGTNQVRIESDSVGAGGGTFYLYMGSGNNDSGTVVMDPPQVQFGVGPSREGRYVREYELAVAP